MSSSLANASDPFRSAQVARIAGEALSRANLSDPEQAPYVSIALALLAPLADDQTPVPWTVQSDWEFDPSTAVPRPDRDRDTTILWLPLSTSADDVARTGLGRCLGRILLVESVRLTTRAWLGLARRRQTYAAETSLNRAQIRSIQEIKEQLAHYIPNKVGAGRVLERRVQRRDPQILALYKELVGNLGDLAAAAFLEHEYGLDPTFLD